MKILKKAAFRILIVFIAAGALLLCAIFYIVFGLIDGIIHIFDRFILK